MPLPTFPRLASALHLAAPALLGAAGLLAGCGRPEPADPRFTAVPGADAARGRLLAERYQCGRCHVVPGVPAAAGRIGPTLEHFGLRSYIAGQVPSGPDTLPRWIEHPQALVPGTAMPDLGVTRADARDIAAYLLGLR